MCVLERECVCVSVCVSERERVRVCVSGSVCVLWNGVEERGCELESEYEITRRRYSSSLLVVVTRVT